MNEYTRIYLPLSKDEFIALQERAVNEIRHPRDQARHLLRQALGLISIPPEAIKANIHADRQVNRVDAAAA